MIRRGTLSSAFVERIQDLVAQWSVAVVTLPQRDLIEQRDQMREAAADGGKPEALVLQVLDAEIRRRESSPRRSRGAA